MLSKAKTPTKGGNTVFYQPGDDSTFGPFYRTYTGHEDLWMFGLLNANARLYNPYLGRFISPDPLLNSEGGPLDYNPYIYARNNPYRYIDRNGEVGALVALGIAGLIGGGLNVWANWDDINNAGDFLLFFGVGAVSGVVGAAAVAMAPAGFFAGALYGAVGGGLSNAILGGGNAAILGQDVGSAIFTSAWQGAAMGFVLGGASGYISAKANGLNGWTGFEKSSNIMATRHRPIAADPDKIAAKAKADKALLPTKEYVRPETAMWEIDCPAELPVMILKDNNTVNILRPEIQGYKKCVSKTDLHHSFPRIFDKFVVKYGEMRIIPTENTASYVYPGKCYGEPGYFQVNINTNDGEVYHRFFWKASQRSRIYVGHGENKVYFYK